MWLKISPKTYRTTKNAGTYYLKYLTSGYVELSIVLATGTGEPITLGWYHNRHDANKAVRRNELNWKKEAF